MGGGGVCAQLVRVPRSGWGRAGEEGGSQPKDKAERIISEGGRGQGEEDRWGSHFEPFQI